LRASWVNIFALFTWKWFYFEELKSFVGKGEVCCLFAYILRRISQNQAG